MAILSGPDFYLHRVDEKDELALLEIYRQCEDFLALGPVATASLEMVRADLALSREEGGQFYGIYHREDGRLLGVVDFIQNGWQNDPAAAYLALLMIASPYRGQNLGAEVVQVVEAEMLKSDGLSRIEAGVQVNNPGAIRFWQRMGYRIVSEATAMPDGTTVYKLEKVVQKPELTET